MSLQTPFEEKLNTWSHAIGALLGTIGLILMLVYNDNTIAWSTFSIVVYGISIIVLFSASTLYHATNNVGKKHLYRIFDHIGIYVLIAGTYTPVLLIMLSESKGWPLFYSVWGIAAFGVILKVFFTGKFELFSTLLYLVMGWLIVFDFDQLSEVMNPNGILWLFAGGMFYTIGIIFYAIKRIPYNHVIWHVFVLCGAICHFIMIFNHVILAN